MRWWYWMPSLLINHPATKTIVRWIGRCLLWISLQEADDLTCGSRRRGVHVWWQYCVLETVLNETIMMMSLLADWYREACLLVNRRFIVHFWMICQSYVQHTHPTLKKVGNCTHEFSLTRDTAWLRTIHDVDEAQLENHGVWRLDCTWCVRMAYRIRYLMPQTLNQTRQCRCIHITFLNQYVRMMRIKCKWNHMSGLVMYQEGC